MTNASGSTEYSENHAIGFPKAWLRGLLIVSATEVYLVLITFVLDMKLTHYSEVLCWRLSSSVQQDACRKKKKRFQEMLPEHLQAEIEHSP